MTYLVLARKWRPRSFDTLIGQEHVVRALTHALSTGRLHHAWLFTGTRGVGKTTLSRILAKSLNCETGITATPCGTCRACTEIDEGRFVDYLELDAASNRGVDEMTQLLEQAVYAPSVGRFKVYMIDEVHMLTGHAFNAMLKTLEEPPPHVKFILATTDPQKIPVTVLSRCLQFNLKQMTAQAIVEHLEGVLGQENVAYEVPALRLIAQAAAGSMRDALSLTDQAIAYSAENLTADAVRGMLGTIDQRYLARLLRAMSAGCGADVLAVADELAARGLSYSGALADLAVLLSRIAIEQRLPGTVPADDPLAAEIVELAGLLHPDLVQLFYSVAVHSRGELSLAPDEYAGFVMACLRMLALAPADSGPAVAAPSSDGDQRAAPAAPAGASVAAPASARSSAPVVSAPAPAAQVPAAQPPATQQPATQQPDTQPSADDVPAWEDPPQSSGPQRQAGPGARPVVRSGNIQGSTPAAQPSANGKDSAPIDSRPGRPLAAGAADGAESPSTDAPVDDGPPESWYEEAGFIPDDEAGFMPADDADGFETLAPDVGRAMGAMPGRGPAEPAPPGLQAMTAEAWPALAASLPLTGLAAELARQSEWLGADDHRIALRVAVRSLAETPGRARLRTVLSEHFGTAVQLDIECGATGDATAHAVAQARREALQREAEQAVDADPFVRSLVDEFGGMVIPGSVQAVPDDKAA